jgi:proton-dependent oligopeptide transporter, POT family
MTSSTAPTADNAESAKGHPTGLYVLFATEMWERFSYYGMRALLVLYLVNVHGFLPRDSSAVYKWYTSLVYLAPLLGGYLADRYLGLRMAIIIGGVLMAIGHFLMAFEPLPFLYTALAFLVVGNGFFKPNISTLVGRMYTQKDKRRDGAFTIFYMGINLGALLAPLVCGWLRKNFGFHYGFAAAGVGMVLGLLVFLAGQNRIATAVHAAGNDMGKARDAGSAKDAASQASDRDQQDEATPGAKGFAGIISGGLPYLLLAVAVLVPVYYMYNYVTGQVRWSDLIMPIAFAGIAGWMGLTLRTLKGALRDKSTVIFALFAFIVLFWMAFEQAGNALNLWAEFHTVLSVGSIELTAEYFQAINPALIVLLGPVFAAMWVILARKNAEPTIPVKMLIGLIFVALSFMAMVGAAISENANITTVPLKELPASVDLAKVNAGRMSYDAAKGELSVKGALPPFAVVEALAPTVDASFRKSIEELEKGAENASEKNPAKQVIGPLPRDFELPFTPKDDFFVSWDPATATITVKGKINAQAKIALLRAGAPVEYRQAIMAVAEKSNAARVSGLWLLLSYFLATLGELCLSPVGLSMVTKLAPARFASLFMGVWLLSNSVAQYVGGALGEMWGSVTPTSYFTIFVWSSVIGSLVLLILVSPLKKLTHGVT